jgi:condensin complex subunit 2
MEKLPHLLNKNEESSWQKASASLDASAKIYGYRVDSVHSETFKFLGGLARADKDAEAEVEEGGNEEKAKAKKEKMMRHEGYSTLEKDVKKLNLIKYDLEFEVDPLFKSMTAKFNEAGARGLLLNNLPLDENLDVLLESKETKDWENMLVRSSCSKSTDDITNEIREAIDGKLKNITLFYLF